MSRLKMKGFKAIFKRELKDSIRDRRALLVAMTMPIFGPILMLALFSSMFESRLKVDDMTLPVIGKEHAPDLISYLEDDGIEIVDFTGDAKAEVQAKNEDVVLEIPEDFGEKFAAFEPVKVQIYVDQSFDKSNSAGRRISRLVERYSDSIGNYRLMLRGVSPAVVSAVKVETRDFSTRKSRAAQILASLQMLMLVAAFLGGSSLAMDTTSGERERHSFEPLLVHPVPSMAIIGGKWAAVSVYATVASFLSVIITAVGLEYISLEAAGLDPHLTLSMQAGICAALLPLALMASALQMLMSLFAKTFKEAQTYLSLLNLLPMVPVMVVTFREIQSADWMYWVPILGQQQIMTSIMRGEAVSALNFTVAAVVTTVLAIAMLAILVRLLRSERIVYGG